MSFETCPSLLWQQCRRLRPAVGWWHTRIQETIFTAESSSYWNIKQCIWVYLCTQITEVNWKCNNFIMTTWWSPLKEVLHTQRSTAHSKKHCTLKEALHTQRSTALSKKYCTLKEALHTQRSTAHSKKYCTLTEVLHTQGNEIIYLYFMFRLVLNVKGDYFEVLTYWSL